MSTPVDRPMSTPVDQSGYDVELATEALLREHPDALVCGLGSDGLIVPIPGSVALWGQAAIEGRALIDSVVTADRKTVIDAWIRAQRVGAAEGKVRMLDRPSRWMKLHFLDIRAGHGVLLGVVLPTEEGADADGEAEELPPATPRFSTLFEDEGAKVLDCDDAFTQMFGYTAAELIGESVLDQLHPDDQGRAVEGWLAMLSTRRAQQIRCRRKRKDGSFMWIDTTLHNYLNQPDRNHVLVEIIDISAEMAAQEALQEREELLRRLTDAMPVGLLQLDSDRNVVYNNARMLEILHGSPDAGSPDVQLAATSGVEQLPAPPGSVRGLLSTLTEEGVTTFEAALGRVLEEGIDEDVEVDMVLPAGDWRRALMSIRTLLRTSGEVSGAITCVLDVTDSARARQELERRATFDVLTGAHNRQSILGAVERELAREDAMTTGVVYVDLDRFKSVNDTLGHAAGDEVLVLVAERLKAAIRGEDDLGRLGGDEFLVLVRDIPEPAAAMRVAERISTSVSGVLELSCESVELRASVGVACVDAEAITAEQLVERADTAMYRSKQERQGLPVLAGAEQPTAD
jgi:diguanylate cyclase (GGDEF)-like protein/PAS domain S-box-containing protein